MTAKELLMEKGSFKATGVIKNITGEANKVYQKTGWMGSKAEITLDINGRKQKVSVFGGVGHSEFPIRVFQKDAEGKILRDAEGKTVQHQIAVSDYNDNTFAYFDKKEVFEWGEKDAEGKSQKITHISELTEGRFANAILQNKDFLIGKRVQIEGKVKFKPTQNFDKIQTDISFDKIAILKPVEDGKEVVDKFIIDTPIVVNKQAINEVVNGVLPVYVPLYHKYVTPVKRDGKEVKGRTVFVPTTFLVKENGFMALNDSLGFDLEMRKEMLLGKLEPFGNVDFFVFKSLLSNKSGVAEREITVEDLMEDQVWSKFIKIALNAPEHEREERIANTIKAYKLQNPLTVRGEFKQEVDFITPMQVKDKENNNVRDGIMPIDREALEIYSLDKIKEETENKLVQTTQTQSTPIINTPSRPMGAPIPQNVNLDNFDDVSEFPF